MKGYDVLGNEVATLVDEYKPAGSYEVEFQSSVGKWYVLLSYKAGNFIQTKKMILLK